MITNEDVSDISHIRNWEDIKKTFGQKLEKYPAVSKSFKAGEFGRLWKIRGQELSLKITTDEQEMQTAKQLEGSNNKGFLDIYEIVEVPAHKHSGRSIPKLQLRIQEFCYPIKELTAVSNLKEFDTAMDLLRGNFETIKDENFKSVKDLQKFYKALKEIEQENQFVKNLANNQQIQAKLSPILLKFIDLLKRVHEDLPNVDLQEGLDIHDQNIMQSKQGVWKLVDF